tara:strand:- start:167 stop:382 length:216 start_codon:yes stop_codon:yes gene_type:complete
MAISQQFLLKVFEKASQAIDGEPAYQKQVYKNLCSIIYHEHQHMTDGSEVNKKVLSEIEDLGDYLHSKDKQ